MSRGLLLNVGKSVMSEVFCIGQLKPDFVAFLCTVGSEKYIDQIVTETRLRPTQWQRFVSEDSPGELGRFVLGAYDALSWLEEKCGDAAQITINPTAGRKWMSMGLGMLGSRTSARQVYIDVAFVNGRPDPATMQVVELGNAQDHVGFLDADLGVHLWNRGDFEGAGQVFGRVRPLRAASRELFSGLAMLCDALHRWNRFEHYGADSIVARDGATGIDTVDRAANELGMKGLVPWVANVRSLLSKVTEVEKGNHPALVDLADLWHNANRCLAAGRPDDAVARLYRALEAVAQWLLHQHRNGSIVTSAVEWRFVSGEQQAHFRKAAGLAHDVPLPSEIGLKHAFELSRILECPGVSVFFDMERNRFRFEGYLGLRNNSICAHGWTTLEPRQAQSFAKQLRESLSAIGVDLGGWDVPTMPRLWT